MTPGWKVPVEDLARLPCQDEADVVKLLGALVAELLGHAADGLGSVLVYTPFIVEGIRYRGR